MIVCDDSTRYTWVLFVKHKSNVGNKSKEVIAPVSDYDHVKKAAIDEGGGLITQAFKNLCSRHQIKYQLTTADSQQFNRIAKGKLGIIEMTLKVAHISSSSPLPRREPPTIDDLWAERASWETNA